MLVACHENRICSAPTPRLPPTLGVPAPRGHPRDGGRRVAVGPCRSRPFHFGRRQAIRRTPVESAVADLFRHVRAARRGRGLAGEARRKARTSPLPGGRRRALAGWPLPPVSQRDRGLSPGLPLSGEILPGIPV